jgi:hypothetical protein
VSAFVDQTRARFGVEPICPELEVSASAYWARRRRRPSPRAIRDEYLLGEIRRVHDEAPTTRFGAERAMGESDLSKIEILEENHPL